MLKSIFCISVATVALVACSVDSPNQDTDTASSGQAESSFTLPYERFTLDNRLEVVLHVDRSDPIVAVTTVIHAGSNRERPGRTCFAHFKAIPEWGGTRNGGTWSDGTIYYEVVPKDAFDKILWIDSDRLAI